jgi:predicted nuclease of predicted toxin-antitoxin system
VNIIANENLYDPMVEVLRDTGHQVFDTKHTELAGALDDVVYDKAVKEKLVIVTMDKDFTRMLRFPPHRCGGIVVVELYRIPVLDATALFKNYWESLKPAQIAGRLVIITRGGVRIRASARPQA